MKIRYNPKRENIEVEEDITGDGKADISVKVRVGALLKRYKKHISGAGLILIALEAAHALGWI